MKYKILEPVLDENKSNHIDDDLQLLDVKQNALERLYQYKINGIIYRSKMWMEYGEKCTKHFLQLQKRNILNEDGTASTNSILKILMDHYSEIFKEEDFKSTNFSLSDFMSS